ncbi:MAG: glycosyltransferase [Gammaproteobacteria bacterium]|nr:MAG: glycosyltransferase [Gammaproteobacteria bacterium]
MPLKKITIIVPAYNESKNIIPFYEAVCHVIDELTNYQWNLLFVNDGSTDETWIKIKELADKDHNVKGINLSRNFGKEIALTAGAEAIEDTEAVILMDADLQHPPSLIPELVQQWESGYQIVATQRTAIEYSWLREIGSRAFYYLMRLMSDINLEAKTTDYRLLDKKVLNVLKTFEEKTRFFRGLIDWMGFRKTYVNFSAPERNDGDSTFKLRDLTKLAINSLTSFSLVPLRLTGYLGIFVLMSTSLLMIYMLITQFFTEQILYTTLAYFVVFNTFLFGVVLAAIGMLALYIGHIHTEVIRRPLYIIQEQVGFDSSESGKTTK